MHLAAALRWNQGDRKNTHAGKGRPVRPHTVPAAVSQPTRQAALDALTHVPAPAPVPVEYAVAVDAYLAETSLSAASRRVYRISLTTLAWPLVGQRPPEGKQRRGAVPPVIPLALFDRADASPRLAAAVATRAAMSDPRTVNRELSALRSAVGWWQDRGWIHQDPTAGLRQLARPPASLPPLTDRQVTDLFGAAPSLREHAFWRVIYDTAAQAADVLALDAADVDLSGDRGRRRPGGCAQPGLAALTWIQWNHATTELLRWLLAGRTRGPVFVTDRRAPVQARPGDICPITRRARMSYRRAAEIFAICTRPLDPAGRGWTLQQLRHAGLAAMVSPRG
jgi:integrase